MQINDLMTRMLDDLSQTTHQVDPQQIEALKIAILKAKRIFVAGKGRTGLIMKAFAMRLMHLGLTVYVVDDVTTPAIQSGDLLIIGSGSGRTTSLVRYAETVGEKGALLAIMTGNTASPIAQAAQTTVYIPASNFKSGQSNTPETVFVMGSLFEVTLGLVCEMLVILLKASLDQNEAAMNARHANLE